MKEVFLELAPKIFKYLICIFTIPGIESFLKQYSTSLLLNRCSVNITLFYIDTKQECVKDFKERINNCVTN